MRLLLGIYLFAFVAWLFWTPKAEVYSQGRESLAAESVRDPLFAGTAPVAVAIAASASRAVVPKSPYEELVELEACYQSHTCNYPKSDPRAYTHAIGQALAAKLRALHLEHPKDPKLGEFARKYMRMPDGFVQAEALSLLRALPPSKENLTALTEGVAMSPDALLVEKALPEFQRYLGLREEPSVHETLARIMAEGAHFSSQSVAERISPFLNARSLDYYRRVARQLPTDTAASSRLREALREFGLKMQGG